MHVTQNKILPQKDTIKKGFTRDPVVASALSEFVITRVLFCHFLLEYHFDSSHPSPLFLFAFLFIPS